jgi:putative ubiquitin-RnfH superfamily antitoxin RatB of RatAB toxin-antitoxin module
VIVTVVWATPDVQDAVAVEVPRDATIADAVVRSGLVAQYGLDPAAIGFAIFGRRRNAGTLLADGDRVELTRPLLADPKAARVRRAREKPLPELPRRVKRGRAA